MKTQRPLPLTVAAILLVLLSLFDFPWLYQLLFPMAEAPPAVVIYSGYVLGIVGLVVAIGLWMLQKWSLWATIVVVYSTSLQERREWSWRQAQH